MQILCLVTVKYPETPFVLKFNSLGTTININSIVCYSAKNVLYLHSSQAHVKFKTQLSIIYVL